MNVAELFVNIGITGAEKVGGALQTVGSFLTDVSGKGLAAKASILGAVYALERFTEAGGRYGNTLLNLQTYTGESTKYLQQLREAFRQSGVDAEEADGSFQGLQRSMAEMALTGQAPKGLVTIFSDVGGEISKAQDIAYTIGKIFEFARKHKGDAKSIGILNDLMESMGVSQGFVVTAKTFQGEIGKITKNVMGDDQLEALKKVHLEWSNFFKDLEMFNSRLTAGWGRPFIKFLDNALHGIEKLEMHMEKPGMTDVEKAERSMKERLFLYPDQQGPIYDESRRKYLLDNAPQVLDKLLNWIETPADEKTKAERRKRLQEAYPGFVVPKVPSQIPGQKTSMNEMNTTVNMYGVENTHDGVSELERHVNYTLRQSPAQGWVT